MFSIFREWWILRQLRYKARAGDIKIVANGINGEAHVDKNKFFKDISVNRFWIFPRSPEAQNSRIAKDKKVLETSKTRIPPFVKEKIFSDFAKEYADKSFFIKKMREIGYTNFSGEIIWGGEEERDMTVLLITGDGAVFDFPEVCSEFVTKHWIFFTCLSTVFIFLAGFTPLFKPFVISLVCKVIPVLSSCSV